jgi:flagellar assembly protein FliH
MKPVGSIKPAGATKSKAVTKPGGSAKSGTAVKPGASVKTWRPHRFLPLAEVMEAAASASGTPLSPQLQSSRADGFQQGLDRGYREGHESGLNDGRKSGVQQGREEGRRQGADAGRREALERFESLVAPVDAMFEGLKNLQADYQSALRKEVVELVAKVARQVIRCELALQPAQLLTLVDETLATMPHAPESAIEVYLNEGDLQRIREIDQARAPRWNLLADAHLEPGECRVKAGNREADAGCRQRLSACMEQISTQLLPQSESHVERGAEDDSMEAAA